MNCEEPASIMVWRASSRVNQVPSEAHQTQETRNGQSPLSKSDLIQILVEKHATNLTART